PIPNGLIYWQEDISELTELIEELEDTNKELSERNLIEHENYKTKKQINTLKEKNRLLDLLQQLTENQIELLDKLLKEYEAQSDGRIRRRLLAMTAVVGSYIKRCGNLLFICEKSSTTDIGELIRCIDESFNNLELLDVECGHDIPKNVTVFGEDAINAYRIFETITEASMENLRSVWIKGRVTSDNVILKLEFDCKTDLSQYYEITDEFSGENGEYSFTVNLRKGGEAV
ncbi:MAG: hypothetical protein ACI4IE_01195, partial [Eubacterium sp.]